MAINLTHVLHLNLITVFFLCGLFIMLLRGAGRPTIYMAVARLISSCIFFLNFMQNYNMSYYGLTLFNPIHLILPLVSFPLQFAYMFSLMRPQSVQRRYWFATLIPPVLFVVLYFIVILTKGRLPVIVNYSQIVSFIDEPELWLRLLALFVFAVELIVLSLKCFQMQRQHVRNLPSDFSYTEGISLNWIRWNILIFLIRGGCTVLIISFEGPIFKLFGSVVFALEAIITTVWILRQQDLYHQPSKKEIIRSKAGDTEFIESNELVVENIREKLKQDLIALLENDEIFKDPDLDRETVCEMLRVNRTYLSQIITHDMNTSFYNLINSYRLSKSIEMMNNPRYQHTPLKNISTVCGFKSASAFSNLFKQAYGKTPTEWREE